MAKNPKTTFCGPIEEAKATLEKLGIASSQLPAWKKEKAATVGAVEVNAVFADHGDLAPDALGVVLDFDGVKVYQPPGDTAYRPRSKVSACNRNEARRSDAMHQRSVRQSGRTRSGHAWTALAKIPKIVLPSSLPDVC